MSRYHITAAVFASPLVRLVDAGWRACSVNEGRAGRGLRRLRRYRPETVIKGKEQGAGFPCPAEGSQGPSGDRGSPLWPLARHNVQRRGVSTPIPRAARDSAALEHLPARLYASEAHYWKAAR